MKTINVAELKAHLSQYLRQAQKGEHIVVRDRQTPIAELVPIVRSHDLWERLAREQGVRLGNGSKTPFKPSATRHQVDWERHLAEAQKDTP